MKKAQMRAIFGTYFSVAKKYSLTGILALLFYAGGNIFGDVIIKLYYRDMLDLMAGATPSPAIWAELWHLLLIIAAIIAVYNLCWRIADFLMVYTQSNVLRELENFALEKLQRHSYNFFIGNFAGSLVAKVKRFVRAFETIHDKFTYNFWQTSVELTGIFIVMYISLPLSIALFFAAWCTVYLLVSYLLAKFRFRFDLKEAAADSEVTGALADTITNILNVKIFTSGKQEMTRFGNVTRKEYHARSKAWYIGNISYAIQGLEMAILEIVGMYLALKFWMNGSITVGTVVLIQSYLIAVIHHIWNIGQALKDFFRALSEASEMVEILQMPLEIKDTPRPEKCRIEQGHLQINKIRFSYTKNRPVFSDFQLDIPQGQRVGIVGYSGVGKSTLFKLILRFIDVTGGSIAIDGQDIRNISQDDLRRHISYVPQDPILFHRSLYENILYARPEAAKEQVEAAAKRAHAHEFISSLPQKYNTLVGERGVKLSGGERQRIAIARVILEQAPILLLDEATSSLDSVSEKYIQEQLKELMRGRTTLAIAHRISTIQQMDRIIVLEKGEIIEDGSHQELLRKSGTYADLWSHQSQGFIVENF
ncbi:MAG: ABC transporter ATP-binding protein [Candidatus Peribacteraceae bacterium]|nr:ABC transporter ATP-binding protein [Candidatus Peribacteraceae bacterium]